MDHMVLGLNTYLGWGLKEPSTRLVILAEAAPVK